MVTIFLPWIGTRRDLPPPTGFTLTNTP